MVHPVITGNGDHRRREQQDQSHLTSQNSQKSKCETVELLISLQATLKTCWSVALIEVMAEGKGGMH